MKVVSTFKVGTEFQRFDTNHISIDPPKSEQFQISNFQIFCVKVVLYTLKAGRIYFQDWYDIIKVGY